MAGVLGEPCPPGRARCHRLKPRGLLVNRLPLRASLVVAMCSPLASSAFAVPAPGLNLAWTTCASEGGTANLDLACNDDFAQLSLASTFVLAAPITGVTG